MICACNACTYGRDISSNAFIACIAFGYCVRVVHVMCVARRGASHVTWLMYAKRACDICNVYLCAYALGIPWHVSMHVKLVCNVCRARSSSTPVQLNKFISRVLEMLSLQNYLTNLVQ